ncbi:hypothetical protein OF83DRAFT_1175907 [Amylostereum chailletii]|nr:hypothetical protein OF83DRAFT_1175907 [Amylostereum chailletii]
MAPSSRTTPAPSTSHPFPTSRTRPAPASVTTATVTATPIGSQRDSQAMAGMAPATTTYYRNTSKTATLVSSSATRKRTRRDTLDENESNDARKSRVRQRLSSTSSMETIRADPIERTSRVEKRTLQVNISRPPSSLSLRPAEKGSMSSTGPLAELNRSSETIEGAQTHRTLRRVGTLAFSDQSGRTSPQEACEARNGSSTPYTSRIPLPLSRSSSMVLRSLSESNVIGRTYSRRELRPEMRSPSSDRPLGTSMRAGYLQDQTHGHADPRANPLLGAESYTDDPTAGKEYGPARFTLRMRPMKKHVEVWDLPEESIYAWGGILVLSDLEGGSGCVIESINLDCSTHAYEGRFSLETNSLPVYSTSFIGSTLRKKDVSSLTRDFDPELGVVLEKNWTRNVDRPDQWYVKFWVPVPMDLFRTRDTRMFRMEAQVKVVDSRTYARASASSGMVLGGISHLRKQKDMDRRITL